MVVCIFGTDPAVVVKDLVQQIYGEIQEAFPSDGPEVCTIPTPATQMYNRV